MATAVLSSPNKRTNVRSYLETLALQKAWPLRALLRVSPALAGRAAARSFFTTWRPPVRDRDAALLVHADRSTVPFDDLRLPAWSFGDGPTVLLSHGWNGRAAQLAPLAAALATAGFRAVAFDHPAHGEAPGKRTSAPEMSRALAAVDAALGGADAVVAHSLGTVATTLAMSRDLAPRRVVYLAPPVEPRLWATSFARHLGLGPEIDAPMQRAIEAWAGVALADLDPRPLAAGIEAPLLIVHDRDDREVPHAAGEALAAAWRGARLLTTTGLGHHRVLRDPEVGEEILRFLAPLQSGPRTRPIGR